MSLVVAIDHLNTARSASEVGADFSPIIVTTALAGARAISVRLLFTGQPGEAGCMMWSEFDRLVGDGFAIHTRPASKKGGRWTCSNDMDLALGVVDAVHNHDPDTVVLITGDGDFTSLVGWLHRRGVRVEVAAFHHSLSHKLARMADGLTFLDTLAACELNNAAK